MRLGTWCNPFRFRSPLVAVHDVGANGELVAQEDEAKDADERTNP